AVVVALAPPSIAFRVLVRLLMGIGAGVYFDFATLSFQVPIELSAPKAATVVIARAIIAWVRIVRICKAPLNFGGRGCLRSNGARTPTRIWTAGGKLENTLIAPNSIPVDQPWAEIISRLAALDERLMANILDLWWPGQSAPDDRHRILRPIPPTGWSARNHQHSRWPRSALLT